MKTNLGCFKKQNQIKLKSIEKKIQKKPQLHIVGAC